MFNINEIQSQEDLKQYSGSELVSIYNNISDKPVKKFRDKSNAVIRTWKAIQKSRPVDNTDNKESKSDDKPQKQQTSRKKAQNKKAKTGVTAFICDQLRKGVEIDKIVKSIPVNFPKSKAGINEVRWCRSKLRADGEVV